MKVREITESYNRKRMSLDEAVWGNYWDGDEDEDWDADTLHALDPQPEKKPEDPDQDKVPNLLMQLKKAADAGGNFAITFKDGSKHDVTKEEIVTFVENYMPLMPEYRKKMEMLASQSKEAFQEVIKSFTGKKALPSIYEKSKNSIGEGKKSADYYIWKNILDNKDKFVVRATKGRVKNDLIGSYDTIEDAREVAKQYPDAKIFKNLSGKEVSEAKKSKQ